jgi:hypothetical protein
MAKGVAHPEETVQLGLHVLALCGDVRTFSAFTWVRALSSNPQNFEDAAQGATGLTSPGARWSGE